MLLLRTIHSAFGAMVYIYGHYHESSLQRSGRRWQARGNCSVGLDGDPNDKDQDGQTALMLAVSHGHPEFVRRLLAQREFICGSGINENMVHGGP